MRQNPREPPRAHRSKNFPRAMHHQGDPPAWPAPSPPPCCACPPAPASLLLPRRPPAAGAATHNGGAGEKQGEHGASRLAPLAPSPRLPCAPPPSDPPPPPNPRPPPTSATPPSACTPNALIDSLAFKISTWASSCSFSSLSRAFSAGREGRRQGGRVGLREGGREAPLLAWAGHAWRASSGRRACGCACSCSCSP